MSTFADMEGDETFDSSLLGHADEVVEERIADDDVVMIKGTKNSSAVRDFFFSVLVSCQLDFHMLNVFRGLCLVQLLSLQISLN